MLKLVVLLSGNGSTLQAIIDAIAAKRLNARICAVISDQPKAFGLQRAETAAIPTHILSRKLYSNRKTFDAGLQQCIADYQPDLVILAGFMRVLGPELVDAFAGKMLNVHPALLPKYPGLHTYERVLAAGDKYHGSTVHIVTKDCDAGPSIAQVRTEIRKDETLQSLEQRVKLLEQSLYLHVIQWFAERRVQWVGDHVTLGGTVLPETGKIFDETDALF